MEIVSRDTLHTRRRFASVPHAVCMSPCEGGNKDCCCCSHWITACARLDRLESRLYVDSQLQREPVHLQQNNTRPGHELKGNLALRQLNSATPFYKSLYINSLLSILLLFLFLRLMLLLLPSVIHSLPYFPFLFLTYSLLRPLDLFLPFHFMFNFLVPLLHLLLFFILLPSVLLLLHLLTFQLFLLPFFFYNFLCPLFPPSFHIFSILFRFFYLLLLSFPLLSYPPSLYPFLLFYLLPLLLSLPIIYPLLPNFIFQLFHFLILIFYYFISSFSLYSSFLTFFSNSIFWFFFLPLNLLISAVPLSNIFLPSWSTYLITVQPQDITPRNAMEVSGNLHERFNPHN